MEINKSMKIPMTVSEESTKKILDTIEEQFAAIGTCEMNDDQLTISKLKAGLANFYDSKSTVSLKGNKDGQSYNISVNGSAKPSIAYWISCAISVVCILFVSMLIGGIFLIADGVIIFYNKKQIENKLDTTLNKIKSELE